MHAYFELNELIQTFSTKSTRGFLQVILEFGCKNNINYASNPKFCEDFLRTSPYVSPTKGRTGKEEVQAFPLEKHPQKLFNYRIATFEKTSPKKYGFLSRSYLCRSQTRGLVLIGFRRWGRGAPFVGILQGVLHILENKLAYVEALHSVLPKGAP